MTGLYVFSLPCWVLDLDTIFMHRCTDTKPVQSDTFIIALPAQFRYMPSDKKYMVSIMHFCFFCLVILHKINKTSPFWTGFVRSCHFVFTFVESKSLHHFCALMRSPRPPVQSHDRPQSGVLSTMQRLPDWSTASKQPQCRSCPDTACGSTCTRSHRCRKLP